MADGDVILGGYAELNSVDRSAYVTSITPNFELEIKERRPFNTGSGSATAVAKDPGIANNSMTWHIVDDASSTMVAALDAIKGTKVAFEIRRDDAAVGSTNPKWTGNCIVPHTIPAITQGEYAEMDLELQIDGAVTYATS